MNFHYNQGDTYIALTKRRPFRPFTVYNGTTLLRVDFGHRKQAKNNQHWKYIFSKSDIDIYHSAKFWFYH